MWGGVSVLVWVRMLAKSPPAPPLGKGGVGCAAGVGWLVHWIGKGMRWCVCAGLGANVGQISPTPLWERLFSH